MADLGRAAGPLAAGRSLRASEKARNLKLLLRTSVAAFATIADAHEVPGVFCLCPDRTGQDAYADRLPEIAGEMLARHDLRAGPTTGYLT
jgi:hypothetical protein